MKRGWILLLVCTALAWFSPSAMAAVQGSHHDMGAWAGTGATRVDTCYPCHGYQETGSGNATLGKIGSMCFNRCHVGGAVAGTMPLATGSTRFPEIGTFQTTDNTVVSRTYGTASTTLEKYSTGHTMLTNTPPAPDSTGFTPPAWPYMTPAGAVMECTSCHDVHSSQYTPFIRANLSDNTAPNLAFCHQCHPATADGAARWNTPGNATYNLINGAHPSEVTWGNAAARAGDRTRRNRRIVFKDTIGSDNNAVLRNRSISGTALDARTASYNPGAKLGDFGDTGNVGCYSCHAAHLPTDAGTPNLLVMDYRAFRLNGTQVATSELCAGCHGNTGGTQGGPANPGVTAYFHPVHGDTRTVVSGAGTVAAVYPVTTGAFNITVDMSGVDNGTNGAVVCTSCHISGTINKGVHLGVAGKMILNTKSDACAGCHAGTAKTNLQPTPGVNQHHVYGGTENYNTTKGYPQFVYFNASDNANLTDGLSCEDCHIFNGTAHNWQ